MTLKIQLLQIKAEQQPKNFVQHAKTAAVRDAMIGL